MAKHYITVDGNNDIVDAYTDEFKESSQNDIMVNENGGRQFVLSLIDENRKYRYKYENNQVVEKSEAERDPIDELRQRVKNRVFEKGIRLMQKSDWKVMRHREEVELGGQPTLDVDQFIELLNERKTLRDKITQFYGQIDSLDRQQLKNYQADFGG